MEFDDLSEEEWKLLKWKTFHSYQKEFAPKKIFYKNTGKDSLRLAAVSTISILWRSIRCDSYVPYLAMNYFDRFLSNQVNILKTLKDFDGLEDRDDREKVQLIAMSCLTIACKMRIQKFDIDQMTTGIYCWTSTRMVMRMELRILVELDGRIQPVTAFTFLNFYNRYFKQFGVLKRRCIAEIIVRAQGVIDFVHYMPTVIASSAFLAAFRHAYPAALYKQIADPDVLCRISRKEIMEECVERMFDLINLHKIRIDIAESVDSFPSTEDIKAKAVLLAEFKTKEAVAQQTTKVVASEAEKQSLAKGKEKAVDLIEIHDNKARVQAIIREAMEKSKTVGGEEPQPLIEGYHISEIFEQSVASTKLMCFDLKWFTHPGELIRHVPEELIMHIKWR